MASYLSSTLGWTANADISTDFTNFMNNTFVTGDTLTLDNTYRLDVTEVTIPSGTTITGGELDFITTGGDQSIGLIVSANVTFDNITISASDSPDSGTTSANIVEGTDYHGKTLIDVRGDDVTFLECSLSGYVGTIIRILEKDRTIFDRCLIEHGRWAIRPLADCNNGVFYGCEFRNCVGDGIKMGRTDGRGPRGWRILECFFHNNIRDGIDASGGFSDALVEDCVFYSNTVAGLDIKKMVEETEDLSDNFVTTTSDIKNVTIRRCNFVDHPSNSIVISTVERNSVLTNATIADNVPQNISFEDCTFETSTSGQASARWMLTKSAKDISVDANCIRLGTMQVKRTDDKAEFTFVSTNIDDITATGAATDTPFANLWTEPATAYSAVVLAKVGVSPTLTGTIS